MATERHPADTALLQYFEWMHLPSHLQQPARDCGRLAYAMANSLPDGQEKTAGLRKLLEAKDCFVRASLVRLPLTGEAGPVEQSVPGGEG
jgi:hypothetical protein